MKRAWTAAKLVAVATLVGILATAPADEAKARSQFFTELEAPYVESRQRIYGPLEAARLEALHPEIFAGFNEEMAEANAGLGSDDIEFPVDWNTFNELEATARGEAGEREIGVDRERFGGNPKREASMREREAEVERLIRDREGPAAGIPMDWPVTPIPGHLGYYRGGAFPNPVWGGGRWDAEAALSVIDEQQDIRQDAEDSGNPKEYMGELDRERAEREGIWRNGQRVNAR